MPCASAQPLPATYHRLQPPPLHLHRPMPHVVATPLPKIRISWKPLLTIADQSCLLNDGQSPRKCMVYRDFFRGFLSSSQLVHPAKCKRPSHCLSKRNLEWVPFVSFGTVFLISSLLDGLTQKNLKITIKSLYTIHTLTDCPSFKRQD